MLFLALQSFALAHASAHSGEPHSHDGIQCEVEAIASESDQIVPTPSMLPNPIITSYSTEYESVYLSAPRLTPPGRAPPPRSPPTSQA